MRSYLLALLSTVCLSLLTSCAPSLQQQQQQQNLSNLTAPVAAHDDGTSTSTSKNGKQIDLVISSVDRMSGNVATAISNFWLKLCLLLKRINQSIKAVLFMPINAIRKYQQHHQRGRGGNLTSFSSSSSSSSSSSLPLSSLAGLTWGGVAASKKEIEAMLFLRQMRQDALSTTTTTTTATTTTTTTTTTAGSNSGDTSVARTKGRGRGQEKEKGKGSSSEGAVNDKITAAANSGSSSSSSSTSTKAQSNLHTLAQQQQHLHLPHLAQSLTSPTSWLATATDNEFLRFLRHCNGNRQEAWKAILAHAAWRVSPFGAETVVKEDKFRDSVLNKEV